MSWWFLTTKNDRRFPIPEKKTHAKKVFHSPQSTDCMLLAKISLLFVLQWVASKTGQNARMKGRL